MPLCCETNKIGNLYVLQLGKGMLVARNTSVSVIGLPSELHPSRGLGPIPVSLRCPAGVQGSWGWTAEEKEQEALAEGGKCSPAHPMDLEHRRRRDARPLLAGELSWDAASHLPAKETCKSCARNSSLEDGERRRSFYSWPRGQLLPKQRAQG